MIYALLKTLHVLGVILWVGGMLFAHFFLRPAAAALEPPQRLTLMHAVLGRFFKAVLVASITVLVTGVWMIGRVARLAAQTGGDFKMAGDWWLMAIFGTLMVAIFGHIRFVLYKRLDVAVQARDWPSAGAAMNMVRRWVSVNLVLGLVIVIVVMVL